MFVYLLVCARFWVASHRSIASGRYVREGIVGLMALYTYYRELDDRDGGTRCMDLAMEQWRFYPNKRWL